MFIILDKQKFHFRLTNREDSILNRAHEYENFTGKPELYHKNHYIPLHFFKSYEIRLFCLNFGFRNGLLEFIQDDYVFNQYLMNCNINETKLLNCNFTERDNEGYKKKINFKFLHF